MYCYFLGIEYLFIFINTVLIQLILNSVLNNIYGWWVYGIIIFVYFVKPLYHYVRDPSI